jgi:hypothetical protein
MLRPNKYHKDSKHPPGLEQRGAFFQRRQPPLQLPRRRQPVLGGGEAAQPRKGRTVSLLSVLGVMGRLAWVGSLLA